VFSARSRVIPDALPYHLRRMCPFEQGGCPRAVSVMLVGAIGARWVRILPDPHQH